MVVPILIGGESVLHQLSKKTEIKFGIDGIDNETHDKYRRNVKFEDYRKRQSIY